MVATAGDETIRTLNVRLERDIAAPLEIVWECVLEELGPAGQMPDGTPFPKTLEPWPGGRWFRDLGDNAGHLWGHVQVIKPPTLLELCGPLFMSYPAVSHVQYRLTTDGKRTKISMSHRAIGLLLDEHRTGVTQGWGHMLDHTLALVAARMQR